MSNITNHMSALDKAIQAAGSIRRLAALIRAKGGTCSDNAPANWRSRGQVPAEHCPAIEAATGVTCEELRPDVPWHVLRNKRRVTRHGATPAAQP